LLAAYFDESGMHAGSRACGIAGFVAKPAVWQRIEDQWQARLRQDSVKVFHAVDCENGTGECSDLTYWNRARRSWLMGDLAQILAGSPIRMVSTVLVMKAWDSVVTYNKPFHERYRNPYSFCFEMVAENAIEWSQQHADSEPIAFCFASHPEHGPRANLVADGLEQSISYGKVIASLTFSTPEKLPLLQTGDLLAYETIKAWRDLLHGKITKEGRPVMWKFGQSKTIRSEKTLRFFNELSLRKFSQQSPTEVIPDFRPKRPPFKRG
jgi:hypothetical protein